ncbi:MAG TPA: cell division protein ZapA [Pseudogracilibacillus sp.]|nr:cell division protein ZapA [Pseudogracilibacillus sp.]
MSEQEDKMKISVEIYNRTYTIVGSEPKEQVEQVAQLVNKKMEDIHDANKHLDTTKLAVLTAVNTMNDYVKLKEEYNELLQLIEEDK